MAQLMEIVTRFGTMLHVAGVLVGAVVALGVLNRILQRGAGPASGKRFRNQLVLLGASLVTVLLVIIALPLGDQTQGQLLSLVGIVSAATITLSSTTFLGNAMAGIMLKTMRNFRSGDFVEVGDSFGRVSDRGLFHTEVQTPQRDLITLPNLHLATSPVTVVRSSGTIVDARCSLGYDVHHTRIEELLLQAVENAELTDGFVQVVELGDFSVTYRAAGLLTEVKTLLAARSRLRSCILDALHEGGVEIVSPDFRNVRSYDPNRSFIPAGIRAKTDTIQDSAPVDVVFDKAEEAEVQAGRLERLEGLKQELKEAEQAEHEADSAQAENWARRRIESLKTRIERLEGLVAECAAKPDDDE